MFKVPEGTKARLRQINRNVSALLREQIDHLLKQKHSGTVHQRASRLCGIVKVKTRRRDIATSKDYLKQYAKRAA